MAKFVDVILRLAKGTPLSYTEGDANFQNLQLATAPIGAIIIYAANSDLPGTWLECHGQSLPTASYSDLYSIIGNTFGGDATNFLMPDTRGLFVRGHHAGSDNDPDYGSRLFGAYQEDEFKSHTHNFQYWKSSADGGSVRDALEEREDTRSTTAVGGDETRPKNLTLNYIMKVSIS